MSSGNLSNKAKGVFMGVAFIAVGAFGISLASTDGDTRVQGVVVSLVERNAGRESAVVEYEDPATGDIYTVTQRSSARYGDAPKIGEFKDVVFDAEDPSDAEVVSSAGWAFAIFVVAGIAIAIGSALGKLTFK